MRIAVFDVGGTYTKYAVSDEGGNLTLRGKQVTPTSKQAFHVLIQQCLEKMGSIDGTAFSLPGFVNSEQGYISLGGSLRYHDNCFFVNEMEEILHLPVVIQNDAKCAALAQIWKGNTKRYHNALVLVFGTGVGGALIQDQQIYLGSHFMSSELSCIITGDLKNEGFQATLGNQFSIPSLMEKIAKRMQLETLTGEEAFALANEENEIVLDELNKFYAAFAIQMFNFQCCYDPDVFLIGGGVSEQPSFIEGIQKATKAFVEKIPLPLPPMHIESTMYKAEANLLGAVYQFLQCKDIL